MRGNPVEITLYKNRSHTAHQVEREKANGAMRLEKDINAMIGSATFC